MGNFWDKYIESDEIKQYKLLESLPPFKNKSKDDLFIKYVTISVIKSYIDDVIGVMEKRQQKILNSRRK